MKVQFDEARGNKLSEAGFLVERLRGIIKIYKKDINNLMKACALVSLNLPIAALILGIPRRCPLWEWSIAPPLFQRGSQDWRTSATALAVPLGKVRALRFSPCCPLGEVEHCTPPTVNNRWLNATGVSASEAQTVTEHGILPV